MVWCGGQGVKRILDIIVQRLVALQRATVHKQIYVISVVLRFYERIAIRKIKLSRKFPKGHDNF